MHNYVIITTEGTDLKVGMNYETGFSFAKPSTDITYLRQQICEDKEIVPEKIKYSDPL